MTFECKGVCEGRSQRLEQRKYNVSKYCSVCESWITNDYTVPRAQDFRCMCCNSKKRMGKKRKGHTHKEAKRY